MTRDELNALAARLHAHPGGAPRGIEQALKALDAYLALSESHPEYAGLAVERGHAIDLWNALQDTAEALAYSPAVAAGTPTAAAAAS
ncbi:hypothetical protein [Streptacidiphilus neutrinimicus]|uniref:hypothetical protein n=1 Tax=Streptacidiphilus neutrinimicus TaxID=105420 RepID=UPI0005AA0EEC|nr:hypothetical protein [Streptacidiphilus neutrinimicus]